MLYSNKFLDTKQTEEKCESQHSGCRSTSRRNCFIRTKKEQSPNRAAVPTKAVHGATRSVLCWPWKKAHLNSICAKPISLFFTLSAAPVRLKHTSLQRNTK